MAMGRPRVRDWGLAIGAIPPGQLNAITDVPGVRVGHTTLISGEGRLQPRQGPVRTGVTVILPHGDDLFRHKVPAAVLNALWQAETVSGRDGNTLYVLPLDDVAALVGAGGRSAGGSQ